VVRTYGAPLGAQELPLLFTRVYRALDERRSQIDALNVFPVPDADTGSNMVLTIKAGLDALRDARRQQVRDHQELAQVVIRGVIRGARGNSGVILSQVLRAVVEETTKGSLVDAAAYARALASAQQLAYSAVVEPVAGTMLTVIAAAAHEAQQAVDDGASLTEVSKRACEATRIAVERTPEQLAVLAEANVVDAGGRGFEVLITAVHAFLTGEHIAVAVDAGADLHAHVVAGCHAPDTYPYEVQYLLDADNIHVGPLRVALAAHGDSVVVVAAGNLVNVHVHTANVGAVIDIGVSYAPPQNVVITDLAQQINTAYPQVPAVPTRQRRNVELVAVLSDTAISSLIGLVDGVHLVTADTDFARLDARLNAALTVVVADTPQGAMRAVDLAQQLGASRRVDALPACDSPLALLAAVSVLHPYGDPDLVLHEIHAVLDSVHVAVLRQHDDAKVSVTQAQGSATTTDDFVGAVTHVLAGEQAKDAQLVTVLFGDLSTLQQRSDVTAVITACCPDAEQVLLDLPGADVIAWVGVE